MTRAEVRLLAGVFACYLPLTFLGLGSDGDSDAVVRAARQWFSTGRYIYSRPPAFPVHELTVAVLHPLGGSLACNLGSLAAAIVLLASVLRLCREHAVPNGVLICCGIAATPAFIIASTSTIDYVWSVSFLYAGLVAWGRKRSALAGVSMALAIGARLTAVVPVAAFAVMVLLRQRHRLIPLAATTAIAGTVAALLYTPAFVTSGYSLHFMHYLVPDWWGGLGLVYRFVYKNVYFVGLQTVIVLLIVAILIRQRPATEDAQRPLLWFATLSIVGVELVFLKVPIEASYLLPALPAAWILAGQCLGTRRTLLMVIVVVQASYNVISFNVARPDVPGAARSAQVGLWVEPGALVTDVRERIRRHESRAPIARE